MTSACTVTSTSEAAKDTVPGDIADGDGTIGEAEALSFCAQAGRSNLKDDKTTSWQRSRLQKLQKFHELLTVSREMRYM